jgi:DeoR/GlpR family transcriptional regulator of sugar metabolism
MKGSGRVTSQRRQRLLNQLERQDSVRISELAATFQVSEITVRRDLDELAEQGLLERFHGGARWIAKPRPDETSFEEKPYLHAAEKDAIGAAAAALIKSEDTVLLNGGTTTLAVLRHIKQPHVRVVTNNAAATSEVNGTDIELILLGGEYRARSCSLFGDLATLTLSQIHASVCILGANGVSARTGLTTSVYPEAAINRLMAERCNGNVIAVTDGSKIGITSNFASVPLLGVKILITDPSANPDELAAIKAAGVQTIVVPSTNGLAKGDS